MAGPDQRLAAFKVGIAAGALLGGLLLPAAGVRGTALLGAPLAFALVVTLAEPRLSSRRESMDRTLDNRGSDKASDYPRR